MKNRYASISRASLLASSLVLSAFFVGQSFAQTAEPTPTPSPTPTPTATATPTPTPSPTPTDPTTQCTSQGYKWCVNFDGATGWCSNSSTYKCPAYTASDCSAQSGEWCTGSGGTSGWCNSTPGSCPINDPATCVAKSRTWCKNSDGNSGWCSSDSNYKCPAYNEADCKAQGQIWCVSTGMSTTNGWCTTSCPYATTSPTPTATPSPTPSPTATPVPTPTTTPYPTPTTDTKTSCTTQGYKWCLNSDGVTGWCSYSTSSTYNCPAANATECTAQNGEWCSYTSGTGGWCSPTKGNCPVNDKASCEVKSRKWCMTSGTITGGWCANVGENCPANTASECTAQNGEWCANQGSSGGWCSQTKGTCPVNDKATCELKSRKWCVSTGSASTSGWCAMTNEMCPVATATECTAQGGEWCKSQYSSMSGSSGWCTGKGNCPINDEATCKTNGRKWCVSNYGGTGWCQGLNDTASMGSGMSCSGTTPVPTPTPTPTTLPTPTPTTTPILTRCPDGTQIPVGAKCPTVPVITCPNGRVVSSSEQCSGDEVSGCLKFGGTWCTNASQGKAGYCAPQGMPCTQPPNPQNPEPTQPPPTVRQLSANETRNIERQRKQILRELKNIETSMKKYDEPTLLAKIVALKDKVTNAKLVDSSAFESLQGAQYDLDDIRDAFQDVMNAKGNLNDQQMDEKSQARALREMKQGLKQVEKFLATIERTIKHVEKQGIAVDQKFKDAFAKAKDLGARTKAAKTYQEIQDVSDQIPDTVQALNDYLPILEQLSRIPKITKALNQKVSEATRAISSATATAKRVKLDATDELATMSSLLAEVKDAVARIKTGAIEGEDVYGYVQDSVFTKVDDILQLARSIQAVANVRAHLKGVIQVDVNRFGKALKKLESKGEDVTEATAALDELRGHLETLKALAAKKLTPDTADELIDELRSISDLSEQLQNLLGLTTADQLEKQLKRSLEQGEEFQPFNVNELEKTQARAYQTAIFFRMSPTSRMAYVY